MQEGESGISPVGSQDSGRDLRVWLEAVDAMGELQTVKGASWDREIGAISDLNYRRALPGALLFDDVADYPAGRRILTGSVSSARRLGYTLGLGHDLDDASLVQALRGRPLKWEATAADYQPHFVPRAAFLDNRVDPGEIDLLSFPVPQWHADDGGRYLGTGCAVVTIDPASGVTNVGAYRCQVQDGGATVSVNMVPGKHGAQHVGAWFRRGEAAPVAISFGQDPLLLVLGGTEVPTGLSELAYGGAVLGRPLDVVAGPVTGLPVPASAEIVIEGWLRPGLVRPEGPFGEWTGYYSASDEPVLTLDPGALYWRDDPIILGSPPAKPPHDYSYMRTVMKSAMIHDALVKVGLPGVAGVWAHESGGGRLLVVVAIDQRYCGHSRQAAYLAAQCQAAAYMNRYVVVVDDDIDPRDLDEVIWAMCTRSDPEVDIEVLRKTWGSKADPLLVDHAAPYNSRAIIDACRPFERRADFPPVAVPERSYLDQVAAQWSQVLTVPIGSPPVSQPFVSASTASLHPTSSGLPGEATVDPSALAPVVPTWSKIEVSYEDKEM